MLLSRKGPVTYSWQATSCWAVHPARSVMNCSPCRMPLWYGSGRGGGGGTGVAAARTTVGRGGQDGGPAGADRAGRGGAFGAEPGCFVPVFDGAFAGSSAGPGAGEPPGDARFGDDLHQAGALAVAVGLQPGVQVGGPVLDLPTVRSGSRWSGRPL